jgi:hypothetical protein
MTLEDKELLGLQIANIEAQLAAQKAGKAFRTAQEAKQVKGAEASLVKLKKQFAEAVIDAVEAEEDLKV